MSWNFNIDEAPKGEIIKQPITRKGKPAFYSYSTAPKIISASSCGKVFTTRWLPEAGRWEGYCKGIGPIAWQPYPVHPKHENIDQNENDHLRSILRFISDAFIEKQGSYSDEVFKAGVIDMVRGEL